MRIRFHCGDQRSYEFLLAGSVLKMFQHAFGDETWSKGLRNYLVTRQFNFSTPDHLYEGLQVAVDEDFSTDLPNVATVMKSWEEQSGFPLVTVSRIGDQLSFTQNCFSYAEGTSASLWWIPINYVVGLSPDFSDTKATMWLPGTASTTVQSGINAPKPFTVDDWIIVNPQQTGYYRVNYDESIWSQIIAQLEYDSETIHVLNRAQLIDDSFHLARADLLNFETHFKLLNYLEDEIDYVPWAAVNRAHARLTWWLSGSSVWPRYQAFMRKNVELFFESLGVGSVASENRINRYARNIAMNIACESQLDSCLTQAAQTLQIMLNTANALETDHDKAIYCNGIRTASETTYRQLQNWIQMVQTENERSDVIAGLGCTQNASLLSYIYTYAVAAPSVLTNEERTQLLLSSTNLDEASTLTLIRFIQPNYAAVVYYTSIRSVCSFLASRITTESLLSEFVTLLGNMQTRNAITAVEVSEYINTAGSLLAWQSKYLQSVEKFFDELDAVTTVSTTVSTTNPTTNTPTTVLSSTVPTTSVMTTIASPATVQSTTAGAGSLTVQITSFFVLLKFLF